MAGRHRARPGTVRTMLAVVVPVIGAAAVASGVVLGSASVSAQPPDSVAIPTFPSPERVRTANVVSVSDAPFAVHHGSEMAGTAVSAASSAVDRRVEEQRAAQARARAQERAAARAAAARSAEAAARSAEAAARAADESARAPADPPPRVEPRPAPPTRPAPAVVPRRTPAPTPPPDERARSAAPGPTGDVDEPDETGPSGLLDGGLLGGSLLGG